MPADATVTSSGASSPPTTASRPNNAAAIGDLHMLAVHTKRTCTGRVYPRPADPNGRGVGNVEYVRRGLITGVLGRALLSLGVLILLFVAYQLWGTGLVESHSQA